MNRTDIYGAFARLLLPAEGDPPPEDLLRVLPEGDKLRAVLPDSVPGENMRVFGPSLSSHAPPYETMYGAAHIFMQSQSLADIAGFYKAFGLNPPSSERPDHLAVELEFMAYLSARETFAAENDGEDKVEICREAQQKFLSEHVGRWIGAFAGRMRKSGMSPFYSELAKQIAEFVKKDCERWNVEPVLVSAAELRVPQLDPEDGCGSCELASSESE